MRLRLLETSDTADGRRTPPAGARAQRRPGERHEPVAIAAREATQLLSRAADAGLTADVAATLLVEARLALDWLQEAGCTAVQLRYEPPPVALSAAEADYLRALTVSRTRRRAARVEPGVRTVSLPVRLIARASPEVVRRSVHDGDLEQAVAMEVHALRGGLLMGEWVARAAARSDLASGAGGD
jgi:hypothetical protein